MIVKSLRMRCFMGHEDSTVELPETGAVLVFGENGSGKSSIVEGVSFAGWGKTLRGDVPWWGEAKPPCAALAVLDDINVERLRNGPKNELTFSGGVEFPTASKSQVALEGVLGPHDLWRRTHVFSSADAMHFTLATDGERKRLIESFLGSDRFDPGLEACRKDLRAAEGNLEVTRRKKELLDSKLVGDRRRVTDAEQGLAVLEHAPDEVVIVPGKPLAYYDERIRDAKREIYDLESRLREAERAGGGFDQIARSAEAMLDRLRGETCPTCSQPIAGSLRKKLRLDADAAKGKADAAREEAKADLVDAKDTIAATKEQLDILQTRRGERAMRIQAEQMAENAVRHHAKSIELHNMNRAAAVAAIAKAQAELVDLEDEIDLAIAEVAELTEVEKVLGLKGFRAHTLGQSLSGIDAVANAWLARLRQGVQIKLSPYAELAKGGTKDAIGLSVIGRGRGSYKSTSGGERRRIDVALLLGLAEVAAAARGAQTGTLFFDEVFDCLDEQGIEAVSEILTELSQTRCVVVITHSKDLMARMRAARKLHIAHGKIAVVV